MPENLHADVEALAALVPDGARVIVNKGEGADTPFALVKAMIREGVRDLNLITLPACAMPTSGMMVDMLIGAGCVARVETSGISLGELGVAPAFNRAVREGAIAVQDATCPALYAAVQAGGKGQPFATLRGLIGTDLAVHNPDWVLIDNPFQPGDRVMALRAITPDVALIHAPLADAEGNIWVGRQRDKLLSAHAARTVLVTVDRVVEGSFFDDETVAAGVIPSFYITALAEVPGGALPARDEGGDDMGAIRAYAAAARDPATLTDWLAAEVFATPRAAE
jgi:glutaconate CoA-transferase subunit A